MDPSLGVQAFNWKSFWYFPEVYNRLSGEAENSWLIKTNPERGWEVECPDISPVNSSADVQMGFWHNLNHKTWKQTWHYCVKNEISPFIWIMNVMSKKYFYKLSLQLWIIFLCLHFVGIKIDIKKEGRKLKELY